MLEPNSNKTMAQAFDSWFKNFSESFNSIKIGKIVSVNTSKQTVDVQVLHKRIDKSNFTKKELLEYPVLQAVPFVVLGGGTSSLTFPISVGDNCLLLFCDYEIDRWWDSGEAQPSTYQRRHDISDAFALIGVHSMVDLLQGYSNYVQLKYSDKSKITIGNEITLDNEQVTATGDVNAVGTVTGAALIAQNGYSGVIPVGSKLLSFANGILISVE